MLSPNPAVAREPATRMDVAAAAPAPRRDRLFALASEVLRYCAVGVLSYGLGIALAALFHELMGLPQRVAVALSLAIVFTTNFFLGRTFVFRSGGRVHGELARFALASAAMRGVEYLLFLALLDALALNYLVSMTAAMAASTAVKFLLYKKLVFRGRAA
jgi:putative flippase GtrA